MTKEKVVGTCFRCQEKIRELEEHFQFNKFSVGKIMHTDYCHEQCWIDFKRGVANTNEAMGMLRGLKTTLIGKGLLPPERVVIR